MFPNLNDPLFQLIEDMSRAPDADTAREVFLKFVGDLGFEDVVLSDIPIDGSKIDFFKHTLPDWWMHQYVSEGLGQLDPLHEHMITRWEPRLIGRGVDGLAERWGEEQETFFEIAKGTGLECGIAFPMPVLDPSVRGAVSLSSPMRQSEFVGLLQEKWQTLQLASIYAHSFLRELAGAKTRREMRPLSPKERDVLRFLSQGHRNDRIADLMGISTATVEFHMRNARSKLGARTREEAIALALKTRQI